jgi:hypothetical protein
VVSVVECTIPPDVTIRQWRRLRHAGVSTRGGEQPCDHVHETTSRYDHAVRRLQLLLVCPVCKTEKVIHDLAYEPRFEPSGATVHPLRRRAGETPHELGRAA